MKKLIVLTATLALFAMPSFALLHIGISGGYAYSNMDQLNNAWEEAKSDAQARNGDVSLQKFGNSVFVNGDIGIGIFPLLHIGPRVGLQYVFPVTNEVSWGVAGTDFFSIKETFSSMLVPLELGATLNLGIPFTPVSVTTGGYAGYGMAFGVKEVNYKTDNGTPYELNYTLPYDGGGFMADLSAAVEWNIFPLVNLSINAGYRYALIEHVNVTKEIRDPITGDVLISADDQLSILPKSSEEKLKVNFSGFLVGAGINIRF